MPTGAQDATRIAMWSGPRNISTAMMRVVREPARHRRRRRAALRRLPAQPPAWTTPAREEILAAQDDDWRARHRRAGRPGPGRPRRLLPEAHDPPPAAGDRARLARRRHQRLPDPRPGRRGRLVRPGPGEPTLADLGFPQQAEIFRACADALGAAPPVVDAADVLADPRGCSPRCAAGSGSRSTSGCWPGRPGRADTDGVWAPHWYAAVEASTGFGPPPRRAGRRCPTTCAACSTAAGPSTTSCIRTGSSPAPCLGCAPCCRRSTSATGTCWSTSTASCATATSRTCRRSTRSSRAATPSGRGCGVYDGRVFRLTEHLARLRRSARALAFTDDPGRRRDHRRRSPRRCAANGMRDGVHIRLTLTRGVKITSGMDPRLNQSGPTLIVLRRAQAAGVRRRRASPWPPRRCAGPGPDVLDPKIHHNNLINSILAKIEANAAGADDALLLDGARVRRRDQRDPRLRCVEAVVVRTPTTAGLPRGHHPGGRAGAAGAGRACRTRWRDLSLAELPAADEVF